METFTEAKSVKKYQRSREISTRKGKEQTYEQEQC
jgi:hypothetical protein